jgi:L-threonylcarbamoyladenylate synthase
MSSALADAVRALGAGGLVVYPTDTLLGLGALATNAHAVGNLVDAKGRPPGMPLSVMLSSTEELESLAELSPMGRRFVRTHLPGPYTLLARPTALARRTLAPEIAGPHGTIGVRVPDHPLARELARRVGPLTATSANRHGEAPCRTVAEARKAFGRSVAAYLPAIPPPSGRPSELVDLTRPSPRHIARRGRA